MPETKVSPATWARRVYWWVSFKDFPYVQLSEDEEITFNRDVANLCEVYGRSGLKPGYTTHVNDIIAMQVKQRLVRSREELERLLLDLIHSLIPSENLPPFGEKFEYPAD